MVVDFWFETNMLYFMVSFARTLTIWETCNFAFISVTACVTTYYILDIPEFEVYNIAQLQPLRC